MITRIGDSAPYAERDVQKRVGEIMEQKVKPVEKIDRVEITHREVSAEYVAEQFGISVQQLEHKATTGESLNKAEYRHLSVFQRIMNIIKGGVK